jgi:hypothetical protein
MQKVESSSLFSRLTKKPRYRGVFCCPSPAREDPIGDWASTLGIRHGAAIGPVLDHAVVASSWTVRPASACARTPWTSLVGGVDSCSRAARSCSSRERWLWPSNSSACSTRSRDWRAGYSRPAPSRAGSGYTSARGWICRWRTRRYPRRGGEPRQRVTTTATGWPPTVTSLVPHGCQPAAGVPYMTAIAASSCGSSSCDGRIGIAR